MKPRLLLLLAMAAMTGSAAAQNLLLHYNFKNVDGTSVADNSASGVTAKLMQGATVETMGTYNVLNLGTSNGYLDMTSEAGKVFKGTDNYTVSAYYYVANDYQISGNGYFLWAFSTSTACSQTGGKYSAYRINAQRIATSTGGWSGEKGYSIGTASQQGQWIHVAYTEQAGTGKLYLNGELKQTISGMPKNSTNYGSQNINYCWIGRAPFSGDSYLQKTRVADFRMYDDALSSDDIATLAKKTTDLTTQMRFATPGSTAKLQGLVDEAEQLISTASNDYLPGAVEDLRDAVVLAKNAIPMGYSSEALAEYEGYMTTAIAAVKSTKGMTFSLEGLTGAYDTNRGFVHPGGLHTQADFDRVKAQLAAGNAKVTEAYNKLKASEWASASAATWPVETIVRGGSGQNYINAARGAHIAYENALMWKLSGDEAHAKHGVEVLMAWARNCKLVSGDSNWALAAGLYGYEFAQAAEILRDYEGWKPADFNTFKRWMLQVWYPGNIHFLRARNGTWENTVGNQGGYRPGHYWSNWPLCNALSVISIGILCDDVFIYNQGMSFIKYDQAGTYPEQRPTDLILNDGTTEFMGNLVVTTSETPLETGAYGKMGQMQESGRDGGHAAMALGLAIDIAKTAWNQGDDLFSYMDNRLAAGVEFTAASTQNTQGLPWTNYKYVDCRTAWHNGWLMTGPAMPAEVRPYWGTVIGHYESVKGVSMPWAEKAYEAMGIDGGPSGGSSGPYDHLSFSVLMNTYDTQLAPADKRPTLLTPLMEYDGKQIAHNELGGLKNTFVTDKNKALPHGKTVRLMPQLPEGTEDTGLWRWNTGETSRNITVSTDRSYVYRATYTNANGVESHQAFSIAVDGDCTPSVSTTGTITYNGTTTTSDTITVYYGEQVQIGLNGTGGYESYLWDNGATTSTITTQPMVRPRTFSGMFISQGGARTAKTFHVDVRYMQVQAVVNGEVKEGETKLKVNKGDRVEIGLYVPEVLSGSTFRWDSGENTAMLGIDSIAESGTYTLSYVVNDEEGEVRFSIYVIDTDDTKLTEGYYKVMHPETSTFLTTRGVGYFASFREAASGIDTASQIWKLTVNPTNAAACNLQNMSDSTYLSATGHGTMFMPRYLHVFGNVIGSELYEVHTHARQPKYWSVDDEHKMQLTGQEGAAFFSLIEVDYNTGIVDIRQTVQDADSSVIYDLYGRRTSSPSRGIYIIGGKKVIR